MTTLKLTDRVEIEKQAEAIKQMILRYGEIIMTNELCGNLYAPSKQYNQWRVSMGFTPDSTKSLEDFEKNPIICISFRNKIEKEKKLNNKNG
jgi:hypothetical protein